VAVVTNDTAARIVVRRVVQAPAARVFDLLVTPARHVEIDGSGMLVATSSDQRLTAVGDVFTVEMARDGTPYRSDNHVTAFKTDRRIAWATARPGATPSGYFWAWELHAEDALTTDVVHTYDWSTLTDPDVLARVSFPRVSAQQMQQTLDRLAAAVG